ncbi:MAG: ATP-binding cassette domain-containing protein [Phaeodactylibacter sp.]|nr:ATP-binding cassette domain-containing protein [Phaeodactylibacter sp.]
MKTDSTLTPVRRFFRLLKVDRKDVFYIYLYASLAGLITLSLPLGIQAIIGLMVGGEMSSSLIILIAVVTLGTAFTGILTILQMSVSETIQRRLFTRSSFEFCYRIPRIRLENYGRYYPPELVNRFFDTLTLQKGIPKILMDFSSASLQIAFGLILISFYHPLFAVFGLVLGFILFLILRFTAHPGLKSSLQESDYKYRMAHWLEEIGRTLLTFKLSGTPSITLEKTNALVSGYLDARKRHFKILLAQFGGIVGFKTLITCVILALGSYLVVSGQINIGQFVASEIVIILILGSVEKLILNMEQIYDVLTALEKIGKVTDMPLDKTGGLCMKELKVNGGLALTLKDLSFRFPDASKDTLSAINLDIKAGEKVCIAGYNGSGKATLVRLISGLYNEFEGSLLINGVPYQNIDIDDLRKHIGDFSLQEDIFRGTIAENICLRQGNTSLMDLQQVCKTVGLMEFIQQAPDGFTTELIPGGRNIPKSVRTKILLARCILHQPPLLALEEFLSGFVAQDRQRLIDFLLSKEREWSLVAISNDLNFAIQCDRVVVMHEGDIVAQGSLAEVLKNEHAKAVFSQHESVKAA